jgi:hypothetical protein
LKRAGQHGHAERPTTDAKAGHTPEEGSLSSNPL